jgi:hypothetical protein
MGLGWYLDRTRLSQKYKANTTLLNSTIAGGRADLQTQLVLINQCFPVINKSLNLNEKSPLSAFYGQLSRLRMTVETQRSRLEDATSQIR